MKLKLWGYSKVAHFYFHEQQFMKLKVSNFSEKSNISKWTETSCHKIITYYTSTKCELSVKDEFALLIGKWKSIALCIYYSQNKGLR